MGRRRVGAVGMLLQTTLMVLMIGTRWTNGQNYTVGGSQGLKTACEYTNEQTTTIDTTDIKYEYQFLLTATLNNANYEDGLADPDSEAFKFQATAFEEEIHSRLLPLLQNPPPSTIVVALDVDIILFHPRDQGLSQGSGLMLECVLSTDSNQFTAATMGSHLKAIASMSFLYPDFVSSVSSSVGYCLREVIRTQEGTITWPVTVAGRETGTLELCPVGTKYVGERSLGSRSCRQSAVPPMHAQWDPYICVDCGEILQVDDALEAIYNEIRLNSSVILDGVLRAVALLNQVTDITELGFKWVGLTLEFLAGLNPISTELLEAILRLLSNLMQQEARIFFLAERQYGSSGQMVRALAGILKATALDSGGNAAVAEHVSIQPNVAAALVDLSPALLLDQWLSFGSVQGALAGAPLNEGSVGLLTGRSLTLLPNCEAYVHMKVDGPVSTSTPVVRSMFVLYHNAKLFQSVKRTDLSAVTSTIAGRVVSADIRASQTPELSVITRFQQLDPTVTNVDCRWWDASLNDGHGEWSTPDCMRDFSEASDRAKCQCNKLTAFTIFGEPGDGSEDEYNGVNGFVRAGAVICLLCLLAAILLYLALKQLRYLRETQILGCLFLCLAAFCLFLVIGIDLPGAPCLVFGALMHYCLLAMLGWLAVAWVHLYDLSQRKPWSVEWLMLKLSGPVWGIPFLFVVITVVVDPNHYLTPTMRCFLSSQPVYNLIATLVVPVVFVVVVVAVAFARTARNIILDSEARPDLDEEGELNKEGQPSRLAKAWKLWGKHVLYLVLVVLTLLVVVFVFLLANATPAGAAEYIFGCLAILLGIFVVVAFCVYHGEVRQAVLVSLGYANSPESRRFQPYWSTGKWQSNNGPSVLPAVSDDAGPESNGNTKRLYLDDTQRSGAQTNQGFNPNSIPLSYIEMQRMGISRPDGEAKAKNGIVVQADCHDQDEAKV